MTLDAQDFQVALEAFVDHFNKRLAGQYTSLKLEASAKRYLRVSIKNNCRDCGGRGFVTKVGGVKLGLGSDMDFDHDPCPNCKQEPLNRGGVFAFVDTKTGKIYAARSLSTDPLARHFMHLLGRSVFKRNAKEMLGNILNASYEALEAQWPC